MGERKIWARALNLLAASVMVLLLSAGVAVAGETPVELKKFDGDSRLMEAARESRNSSGNRLANSPDVARTLAAEQPGYISFTSHTNGGIYSYTKGESVRVESYALDQAGYGYYQPNIGIWDTQTDDYVSLYYSSSYVDYEQYGYLDLDTSGLVVSSGRYEVDVFLWDDVNEEIEDYEFFNLDILSSRVTYVPFSGKSRYDTTVLASTAAFPAGADAVVIATGSNWPDALGGASLAGAMKGPILLTQSDVVPPSVMAEITRLAAKKAVIIGGASAVSVAVENALKTKLGSANVERIAGTSRFDTANKVAARVITEAGTDFKGNAFVATGANFPDSLAASPIAANGMRPIYLVPTTATGAPWLPAAVTKVAILGGTSAVNAKVETSLKTKLGSTNVERLAGTSRYDTAAKIATYGVNKAGLIWNGVAVATGTNFPDALGGGVLQGVEGSVMLLTDPNTLSAPARSALAANSSAITTLRYFGSMSAVSLNVRNSISALLN